MICYLANIPIVLPFPLYYSREHSCSYSEAKTKASRREGAKIGLDCVLLRMQRLHLVRRELTVLGFRAEFILLETRSAFVAKQTGDQEPAGSWVSFDKMSKC